MIVKEPVVKVRDNIANLFFTVNGAVQKSCGYSMWDTALSRYALHNKTQSPKEARGSFSAIEAHHL
jgi:hypothetical protein